MRALLTLVPVAALMALTGCGERVPDRGSVSGVVTYQGKPVPHGFVIFYCKNVPSKQDQAPIRKDGTFEMTNAPLGVVKVVIQVNGAADPQLPGNKTDDDILPKELNATYANLDTTPLEKTVERGENKIDLEIK